MKRCFNLKYALIFCLISLSAYSCATSVDPAKLTPVPLSPSDMRFQSNNRSPLRVAIMVDQAVSEYIARGKDSIGIPMAFKVTTLPEYYQKALASVFETVNLVNEGDPISGRDFDLTARMTVNNWFYKVPIQTYLKARLDLDITFDVKKIDGGEAFNRRITREFRMPWKELVRSKESLFVTISREPLESIFIELANQLSYEFL